MNKKSYKKPQIKIFVSDAADILTASGVTAAESGYAGATGGFGYYTTTPADPNMK